MKFFRPLTAALAIRTARKRSETRYGKLLAVSNEQRLPWYRRETGDVPNYAWVMLGALALLAAVHYFIYPPF